MRPNIRDGAGVGSLLRSFRRAAGLTQRDLARQAGLSLGAVRDLEQGRTKRPERDTQAALVAALSLNGVQAGELAPAAAGSALGVQVLGPLVVRRDGIVMPLGGPAQQAVLGMLALSPNSLVRKVSIIDVLWPDSPPVNAAKLIQAHVSRIRRVLALRDSADPAVVLSSVGACYRLRAGPAQLDLLRFSQLAADARAASTGGDHAAACDLYEQAIGLWRGDALADMDLLRGYPVTIGVNRQRTEIVIEYAQVASTAGWHGRVLPLVQELADREPLNEQAHAQMMIALAGSGRQAEALAVYQGLCRRLNDELGMPPGLDLARAHRLVLRQEVPALRASVTLTNPPPNGGTPPFPRVIPHQIPTRTRLFVGRIEELKALSALLDDAEQTRSAVVISVIGGTAGVGKTALAVHWAHQVKTRFPDGQLYVNLRGYDPSPPVPAWDALAGFLRALGVPGQDMPAGPDERAAWFRSLLAGRRVLVVLDNARDAEQVRPLLPGTAGCLALVTSRDALAGLVARDGAERLDLGLLPLPDAVALLRSLIGSRAGTDQKMVTALAARCARLPLALRIAAELAVARPAVPLAELVGELSGQQQRLDMLEAAGDDRTAIRAVFSWSYQNLSQPAARLFRLLGLHPGPDITVCAAASLARIPPAQARRLLGELARAHLLTEQVPGRFGCHDLLRAYAIERAVTVSRPARQAAQGRLLDYYLHTAAAADRLLHPLRRPITLGPPRPGVTPEHLASHDQALAWLDAEHRGLLAAVTLAAGNGFDVHAWQLPFCLETFFYNRSHWQDWADTQNTALAAACRLGDPKAQSLAYCGIANAQTQIGQPAGALSHLAIGLRLCQDAGDVYGQAQIHLYISRALEHQGHYREALARCRKCLQLVRTAGMQAQPLVANALNGVGWYLAQLGRYRQALGYCQRAVALSGRLGHKHLLPSALDSLAYVYQHLDHHGEAADCYNRAVDLLEELGHHWHKARTLTHVGDAHQSGGNLPAARQAWTQALAIFDDLHQPDAEPLRAKLHRLASAPGYQADP